MLMTINTVDGIARETAEKLARNKGQSILAMGLAMAAASGPPRKRWGTEEGVYAGVHHNKARPCKKAKRKRKQDSQRKNRKK